MKKIISMVLMLCVLFSTGYAQTFRSPRSEDMYSVSPAFKFELVQPGADWDTAYYVMSTEFDIKSFTDMYFGDEPYWLDEAFLIQLDKTYARVLWTFPHTFYRGQSVYAVLIATDLSVGYFMNGHGTKKGELQLNFYGIDPGEYYLMIYIAE